MCVSGFFVELSTEHMASTCFSMKSEPLCRKHAIVEEFIAGPRCIDVICVLQQLDQGMRGIAPYTNEALERSQEISAATVETPLQLCGYSLDYPFRVYRIHRLPASHAFHRGIFNSCMAH